MLRIALVVATPLLNCCPQTSGGSASSLHECPMHRSAPQARECPMHHQRTSETGQCRMLGGCAPIEAMSLLIAGETAVIDAPTRSFGVFDSGVRVAVSDQHAVSMPRLPDPRPPRE